MVSSDNKADRTQQSPHLPTLWLAIPTSRGYGCVGCVLWLCVGWRNVQPGTALQLVTSNEPQYRTPHVPPELRCPVYTSTLGAQSSSSGESHKAVTVSLSQEFEFCISRWI